METTDFNRQMNRPIRKNEISGVSRAIHKTMISYEQNTSLINKIKPAEFTIKVANTLEERETASSGFKLPSVQTSNDKAS